ncbi:hypothetical protein F383_29662 [Gossypium arboreum]|uniref:Uncharacterized protein n=1 Tax=Gossypium arboreum TaxID=29729 RepID=A0A0B0PA69_GOSAR|nr:hypothetical protein F383_29662 [Gossypium arboreum]
MRVDQPKSYIQAFNRPLVTSKARPSNGMANVVRSAQMWGGQYVSQGVMCRACVVAAGGCSARQIEP